MMIRPRPIGAAILALAILGSACAAPVPAPQRAGAVEPAKVAAAAATNRPAANAASASPVATTAPMEILGKFALAPTNGPWGTPVTASAVGLKPQARYDVVWTTVNGAWKLSEDRASYLGRTYTPAEIPLKTVTTDAAGGFSFQFAVPAKDFGFQHTILVRDEGGKIIRNKAGFDVDLEISISPKSGPVGTPITIEARGVGWRDFQGAWMAAYDNQFTGLLSAVTTKGLARAVIRATGRPGTHIITVLSGDLNFMYLNMQQSPEPDRPQFHIPFTLTEGPAVLPPPVAQQTLPILPAKPVDQGIWVSPSSGIVGSPATLSGKALPANAEITLTYLAQVGNRVTAAAFSEQGKPLGKARTDASGSLNWSFLLPDDLGGVHKIIAKVGDKVVADTDFIVQPNALPLTVERGPSGTKVTFHVKGVGWTETANFYALTYDNGYLGYGCGFNSSGDVQITLSMSGDKGWHFIDLYPGLYKGIETRPLNFRIPQLTAPDDHPGENLPVFHYAFYID